MHVPLHRPPFLSSHPTLEEYPRWRNANTKTRHLIIELPQPGSSLRPDKSTVLGQCGASMVRQGASGEGSLLQNGVSPRVWIQNPSPPLRLRISVLTLRSQGQATIEVVRLPELEAKGVNPWRVSSQTVNPAWVLGNQGVLEGLHAQGS